MKVVFTESWKGHGDDRHLTITANSNGEKAQCHIWDDPDKVTIRGLKKLLRKDLNQKLLQNGNTPKQTDS